MLPLAELPWFLLIWLSERRIVEGCEVLVVGEDSEEVFRKVGDALRLVREYGPRFHARLRRDVRRLLLTDTAGGTYLPGLNTCRIGIDYVRRVPPLDLAMMIVHEATHARLSRLGFPYVGECRERIERACVDTEITFARRVPGSEAAIERTRALLETQWWTLQNSTEATLAELKERGVPNWLTRILALVASRRR